MMVIPSPGGVQETTCLKLDLVNGWLFGVDSSRIKDDDVRRRVQLYQRECYQVLFEHFHGARLTPIEGDDSDQPESTRVRMVTETRHTFGNRAAAELWFKLRLPIVPAMLHDPSQGELFELRAIKSRDDAAAA